MELRHLTDDDLPAAATVFVTSLGHAPPKEPERFAWYWDVPRTLGAFEGDLLLGVAARFDSRLTAVGGQPLRCCAVPSVGVRTDSHGRGVGRALLERQVAEAVEAGDEVMALNASEVGIYGRFGYGPTSVWWGTSADPRWLSWRADAPRAAPGSVREVDVDEASKLLPAMYERAFGRWGGELWRHEGWWRTVLTPRQDRPAPLVAVHTDDGGSVDAAVMFSVKDAFDEVGFANEVTVHNMFGIDETAEALLLRWLCERNLVGKLSMERCNPRTPVKWMLEDPRRWVTKEHNDAVWVRVLDVPAVASARTTLAADGDTVAVRVEDALVAANDRTFALGASDGRVVCEPTDETPQLTVGVDVLASLLWGFAAPSTLAAGGRIGVTDPAALPRLDALLAVAVPSWCSTGF